MFTAPSKDNSSRKIKSFTDIQILDGLTSILSYLLQKRYPVDESILWVTNASLWGDIISSFVQLLISLASEKIHFQH